MKVKRLELKGFRGFDEIVLDFDTNPQRPTVFIGNNGVGKSSILDSLAILLSYFISELHSNLKTGKKIEFGKRIEPLDTNKNYQENQKNIEDTIPNESRICG